MACAPQTVKMGVQYSLWGGSVLNLGTERHRRQYFEDIDKFRLPGGPALSQRCVAMPGMQHHVAEGRRPVQAALP